MQRQEGGTAFRPGFGHRRGCWQLSELEKRRSQTIEPCHEPRAESLTDCVLHIDPASLSHSPSVPSEPRQLSDGSISRHFHAQAELTQQRPLREIGFSNAQVLAL